MTVAVTPNLARSNILVITGPGRDAGKTEVGIELARGAGPVIAVKLVETGCGSAASASEDGVRLAAASGQDAPARALVTLAASLPPAVAAEREGTAIDFDEMLLRIEGVAANAALVVVEGTGGLLTPIGWDWNLVDLAQALEARVLVVARDSGGVVSDVLLMLSALEIGGVPVAGIVLTAPRTPDASTGTNAGTIERLSGQSRVISLAHPPAGHAEPMREISAWCR